MASEPKALVLAILLLLPACDEAVSPPLPTVSAWIEAPLHDSLVAPYADPELWQGLNAYASQEPADTTFSLLQVSVAGGPWITQAVDTSRPMERAGRRWLIPRGIEAVVQMIAWGPAAPADTAVWVQGR